MERTFRVQTFGYHCIGYLRFQNLQRRYFGFFDVVWLPILGSLSNDDGDDTDDNAPKQ